MPVFDDKGQNQKIADLHHREEENLVRSLAAKYDAEYMDLEGISIDAGALSLLPENVARKAEMAIFHNANKELSVAMRNPGLQEAAAALKSLEEQGYTIKRFMASLSSIEHAWERYGDINATSAERHGILDVDPEEVTEFAARIESHLDVAEGLSKVFNAKGPEKITKTIEIVFAGALALGASDIHIEPKESAIRIRYRLDGVLFDISNIDISLYKHLISRFKLLSGLTLNITDEAQDGRFTFDIGERSLEIRTSVIPGSAGETIVMRLLDPDASAFQMEKLGLNDKLLSVLEQELKRPNGAIITTGPTGSGKTTALYAFLQQVHHPEIKIISIEDPVEYKLEGVVQTQVGEEYTFASGLRAILRQDPDVLLVGEIRDRDVAETVVQAAQTGHLVFSTLHTNSAVGAFPRLLDLGVDPLTLGASFNLIMAQRLVRKLCEHCRVERDTTVEEQKVIARVIDRPVAMTTVYDAPGCAECGDRGYKGRIGIFEGILVDKAVEEAVIRDPRESNILTAAEPQDIPSMQEDGIMKALAGITSFDELSRVIDLYNFKTTVNVEEETGGDLV